MIKVIAFGAGNFFNNMREEIEKEYDIVVFCDNDSKKVGTVFHDKHVISAEELDSYKDLDILITSIYKYEIIEQLLKMGVDGNRIHVINPDWVDKSISMKIYEGGGVHVMYERSYCSFS